jgi:hypothetical protein
MNLAISRRRILSRIGGGFGLFALRSVCSAAENPFDSKKPHFAPKARRVIFLFMNGGMSQVDTFDPKPMLAKYHGQPVPGGNPKTERKTGSLMRSPFAFRRCGQNGIEVSEIFPKIGDRIDDICVIRSMHTDIPNHEPEASNYSCGASIIPKQPSQTMPAFHMITGAAFVSRLGEEQHVSFPLRSGAHFQERIRQRNGAGPLVTD